MEMSGEACNNNSEAKDEDVVTISDPCGTIPKVKFQGKCRQRRQMNEISQ